MKNFHVANLLREKGAGNGELICQACLAFKHFEWEFWAWGGGKVFGSGKCRGKVPLQKSSGCGCCVFSPASQDVAGKSLQQQQQKQKQHSKNKPKRNAGGIIKFQVSTFPAQHPVAKNPEPNKYIYIYYIHLQRI